MGGRRDRPWDLCRTTLWAVVIFREEEMIALNCKFENNKLTVQEAEEEIYFGDERQRCAKCIKNEG